MNKVQEKNKFQFYVSDMHCGGCVRKVEACFNDNEAVSVNLASRSLWVETEDTADAIITRIKNKGFTAQKIEPEQNRKTSKEDHSLFKKSALLIISGFAFMFAMLMHSLPPLNSPIWLMLTALTLGLMLLLYKEVYVDAFKSFKYLRPNMNSLVGLGTLSAFIFSAYHIYLVQVLKQDVSGMPIYYESALLILGFIAFGQGLEARARRKAQKAMERLLYLTPQTAKRLIGTEEKIVPIDEIEKNDKVKVLAGERIPADGIIIEGTSDVSETFFTGEPGATYKEPEDKVLAGSLNHTGTLLIKVTHTGQATEASRVIHLIHKAQSEKPQIARTADSIAAVFTPIILVIATATAAIWLYQTGQVTIAFTTALSVLVIACPCALGLATPISVVLSMSQAAHYGLIFRRASALEKLPKITRIIFDKTGTLTKGEPSIASFHPEEDTNPQEIKEICYALQKESKHPLALAFTDFGVESAKAVEQMQTLSGMGIYGVVNNNTYYLGNPKLMQKYNINYKSELADVLTRKGETLVILANNEQAIAYFGVQDKIRDDAPKTIEYLKEQGYQISLLSGDNAGAVKEFCTKVGIKDFKAGLSPADKLAEIANYQKQKQKVLMVGDGINDAPALKMADCSIAMGTGTDTAIEAADITLKGHNLWSVIFALELGKACLKNIKQNLFGAFIFNSLAIPVAAGVFYPFTGWLLNPALAGAAMALSSVTVVLSASRMRLWKAPVYKKTYKKNR